MAHTSQASQLPASMLALGEHFKEGASGELELKLHDSGGNNRSGLMFDGTSKGLKLQLNTSQLLINGTTGNLELASINSATALHTHVKGFVTVTDGDTLASEYNGYGIVRILTSGGEITLPASTALGSVSSIFYKGLMLQRAKSFTAVGDDGAGANFGDWFQDGGVIYISTPFIGEEFDIRYSIINS